MIALKTIKHTLYVCLFPVVLMIWATACARHEQLEEQQQDEVEIRINSGITVVASSAVTRAGEGMIDQTLKSDLNVSFVRADKSEGASPAYPSVYGTGLLAGTVSHTAANTPLSFSPKAYYLRDGRSSKLAGCYPQGGTYQQADRTVSLAVDGSTDIMVTKLVEGDRSSPVAAISFEHVLTQVSVQAYAADDAAKTLWGGIKSVKIKGMKQSCMITFPDPSTANAGADVEVAFSGTDDLNLIKKNPADNKDIQEGAGVYGDTNPLTLGIGKDNAVLAGYAMFAPVGAGADAKVTLEITMGDMPSETKEVPLAAGYLKAGSYVISLKFISSGVEPAVAVEQWKTGASPDEIEL